MPFKSFFAAPSAAALAEQGRFQDILRTVIPVPSGQEKKMLQGIGDLSYLLTQNRSALKRSYWASPHLIAAYCYYFLPWNIYRLSWLLPQIDLALAPGATVLDLGSGPLSIPLALWLVCPELRRMPLTFICVDNAIQPLETGRKIFYALAGQRSAWRIHLQRNSLGKALLEQQTPVQCVTAGNILNELFVPRGVSQNVFWNRFISGLARHLAARGRFFCVEPGTRLGGKIIYLVRNGGIKAGLLPLAPCTHTQACPMGPSLVFPESHSFSEPGKRPVAGGQDKPVFFSSWCHAVLPTGKIPAPLAALSQQVGMQRKSFALSWLLSAQYVGKETVRENQRTTGFAVPSPFERYLPLASSRKSKSAVSWPGNNEIQGKNHAPDQCLPGHQERGEIRKTAKRAAAVSSQLLLSGEPFWALVLSSLFRVPGYEHPARYACSSCGLLVLLDAAAITPGTQLQVVPLGGSREGRQLIRDKKTGALLVKKFLSCKQINPGNPRSEK